MLKSSLFHCDPNLRPLLPHPDRSGWRTDSLSIPRNAAGTEPGPAAAALTRSLHFFSPFFPYFRVRASTSAALQPAWRFLRGSLLCKAHVTNIKSVITDKIRLCWARGLSLNQTGVRQGGVIGTGSKSSYEPWLGSNSLPSPQSLGLIYTGILQGRAGISNSFLIKVSSEEDRKILAVQRQVLLSPRSFLGS